MNQSERDLLEKLDNMVLTASPDELQKIQEIDLQTQLEGMSFYDAFVNSTTLANQSMKQESQESNR